MDIKKMLISVAVRLLAENTDLVRRPDSAETLFANLFGMETEHDRVVRQLDEASDKVIARAKKIKLDRQFKQVTKNF